MSRKDFDRFIKRKQNEKAEKSSVDDKNQLKEWFDYLDKLYNTINGYLKPYIDDGSMSISYRNIEINEEFSGTYEVRSMSIHIGAAVVLFKPIGTMLIGSKGRVDVHGPRGTARLSLVNRNFDNARQMIQVRVVVAGQPVSTPEPLPKFETIDWVWKIMSPAPAMKFIDLNEENFFDMIIGIADA